MSTAYDERDSAGAGYRSHHYYPTAHESYGYDAEPSYHQRKNPADKKKALNRLRELKPLVDRIINDCTIQSKEVKSGLQQIKDYQTGVLGELKDLVEEDDERGSYYEVRESSAEGYHGPNDDIYELRDQKEHLRNQLEGEAKVSARIAEDYQALESDYNKLKGEVERLRRKNRFDGDSVAVERKPYRDDLARTRPSEDVVRARSRSKVADDYTGRQYNYQARRSQSEDIYEQNQRLKRELNEAYNTIDRLNATVKNLERRLRSAEDELDRTNVGGGRRASDKTEHLQNQIDRLNAEIQRSRGHPKGDLSRQIAELKQQNEDLRVETIRLLKAKSGAAGGVSQEVADLQNEIMNLHDSIERQNEAKRRFIEDVDEYKRKLAALEAENRELKSRGGSIQYASPAYEVLEFKTQTLNFDYQPSGGAIYSEMANVMDYGSGGDKLSKYKGFLEEIRANKPFS